MNATLTTAEVRLHIVDSTMNAAKAMAGDQDFFLISAREQTAGKGTRGRVWQSPQGNVYMTVGIHRRRLSPERMALLPLEMGLLLRNEIGSRLSEAQRRELHLKWPNDLLLAGRKIAGILMESHGEFMLIGFGINLAAAPVVADGGTPSARLADFGLTANDDETLATGLFRRIVDTIVGESAEDGFDAERLLLEWQAMVDWNEWHRLRDREGTPRVLPIAVNRQGHLLVRHEDGREEWLVAEYLA